MVDTRNRGDFLSVTGVGKIPELSSTGKHVEVGPHVHIGQASFRDALSLDYRGKFGKLDFTRSKPDNVHSAKPQYLSVTGSGRLLRINGGAHRVELDAEISDPSGKAKHRETGAWIQRCGTVSGRLDVAYGYGRVFMGQNQRVNLTIDTWHLGYDEHDVPSIDRHENARHQCCKIDGGQTGLSDGYYTLHMRDHGALPHQGNATQGRIGYSLLFVNEVSPGPGDNVLVFGEAPHLNVIMRETGGGPQENQTTDNCEFVGRCKGLAGPEDMKRDRAIFEKYTVKE